MQSLTGQEADWPWRIMCKLRWDWQQHNAQCMLKRERRQRPQLQRQLTRMGSTCGFSDALSMPGEMADPTGT